VTVTATQPATGYHQTPTVLALKAIVPRVTSMELAMVMPCRDPERIVTLYGAEYFTDYPHPGRPAGSAATRTLTTP
jgi:hypothetical protein